MPSAADPAPSPAAASSPGRAQIAWALLVFTLLAVAHTWPLASNPAHLSRNDTGDYLLNEWIVSWVARQLVRDPSRLFDANIFHPEQNVLAFSEPLLVPGLMAVPMRGLGASPVLTYNLLLLIGFTLTALAMYVFVTSITGNHLSGLLAGSILAFNTHTLTRIAHLQIIHAEWLPLAIWMFDRVLTGARTRDALWLALFVVLLTFTSGYLAMFVVLALVAGFLARPEDWWGARAKPVVGRLALAGALSLMVALPVMWPYRQVRAEQGLVRALPRIAEYSATPWAYLTTTSRLHYDTWSQALYKRAGHDKFFTGFAALALALVALWGRRTSRDNRLMRMLLAMALAGFILSLGVNTPVYQLVYHAVPPMQGLRAVSRFGYLVIFAVAVLAGMGLARLHLRMRRRRFWLALAFGAIAAVNLEALHAPFEFRPFLAVSPVYDVLAREQGRVVVAEFPFYPTIHVFRNADYVFNSAFHWHKLVNGYSGFVPRSYRLLAPRLQRFPDAESLRELRALGVTHVVFHPGRYASRPRARVRSTLDGTSAFSKILEDQDGVSLYRLQ